MSRLALRVLTIFALILPVAVPAAAVAQKPSKTPRPAAKPSKSESKAPAKPSYTPGQKVEVKWPYDWQSTTVDSVDKTGIVYVTIGDRKLNMHPADVSLPGTGKDRRAPKLKVGDRIELEMIGQWWLATVQKVEGPFMEAKLDSPQFQQPIRALAKFTRLIGAPAEEEPSDESRKWQDAKGKFSVVAELVDLKDGTVRLRKQDGKVISVPLDKLSEDDQKYLKKVTVKPVLNEDAPWRKSYQNFLAAIKVVQDADGKSRVEWINAPELTYWYELEVKRAEEGFELLYDANKTRPRIEKYNKMVAAVNEAHKALEGVEWSAELLYAVKTAPDLPAGAPRPRSPPMESVRFKLPEAPKPLTVVFEMDKADAQKWTKLKPGDTVRFTCRFDVVHASKEQVMIKVHMTPK